MNVVDVQRENVEIYNGTYVALIGAFLGTNNILEVSASGSLSVAAFYEILKLNIYIYVLL